MSAKFPRESSKAEHVHSEMMPTLVGMRTPAATSFVQIQPVF
jgi:hypothetical protein